MCRVAWLAGWLALRGPGTVTHLQPHVGHTYYCQVGGTLATTPVSCHNITLSRRSSLVAKLQDFSFLENYDVIKETTSACD